MPFFIQTFRRTHLRLKELEERTAPPPEEDQQDGIAATYGNLTGFGGGMLMPENSCIGGGGMPMPGNDIDMSGFDVGGQPQMMPNGGMPQMM